MANPNPNPLPKTYQLRDWSSGGGRAITKRVKTHRKVIAAREFTQAEVNAAIEQFLSRRKA